MTASDGLRVAVLSSGSTGNAAYIETDHQHILVDAGLSGKKLEELMQSVGRSLNDVDTLLVSHEHSDHRQSVGVLARRYDLNVYANEPTWHAMTPRIGVVPTEKKRIFAPDTVKTFGDIDVESFAVSHDAAQAQFYAFHHDHHCFVILTDTGTVTDSMRGVITDANGYLFEANHDTEMLEKGDYSWPLKQRILGDSGHLSNEDGANALMDVIGNDTKTIFLGHRSLHNNMKTLAHLTVSSMMADRDFGVDHDFKLYDTDHGVALPLMAI